MTFDEEDWLDVTVAAFTRKCRGLTSVYVNGLFLSSANDILINIAEYCLGVESISSCNNSEHGFATLDRLDLDAIASLTRLGYLEAVGSEIADEWINVLAGCRELRELHVNTGLVNLGDVLSVIGPRLTGLTVRSLGVLGRIGSLEGVSES
jgi:hypothetical protein